MPTSADGDLHAVTFRTWLPALGMAVGILAALPHFVTPRLETTNRVEIADHVIPGIVVIAVSLSALTVWRRAEDATWPMFISGLAVLLAGLWMALTHLPLIAQASRHEAPWGAALYHSASAASALTFGLVWVSLYWRAAA